jgi:hypothetical protein
VVGSFSELIAQSADVLDPGNLIFLYLSFVVVKICHEFSHAFACKRFCRLKRSAGEVHSMGVMFLVLFPLPYVDASSAWSFRNKWHRAIVGMAGVLAELAVAAIAAIVWSQTSTGAVHIIAYNVIFIASVSTLLFNGNPLLRFDAYYVLSDLIEIPNLAVRARNYLYYVVKRYVWSLRRIQNPAYSLGERIWFLTYGPASTVYRIFISIRILLFLNNRLPPAFFIIVPVVAIPAVIGWLLTPLSRFVRYLATGPYLKRGERIGFVGGLDDLIVRATAGQEVAAKIFEDADPDVEIRVKGRPDVTFTGRIERIFPAGQDVLPSEALSYTAGGSMPTRPGAPQDTKAAERFFEIRIRPVVVIPTNRPCMRKVLPDLVLANRQLKWQRLLEEVRRIHATGRPVLIGTRSVRDSEALSRLLTDEHLGHQVLNAVRHREEAQIVAGAGQPGQITVATNMAGRGTDIKLGRGVAELGGLHVIAAERNESGRIDRQLFGRCARQGDPGTAQAIVCLEDEFVSRYTAGLTARLRRRHAHATGDMASAATGAVFRLAQLRAERFALRQRKAVMRADHWLDENLGFAGTP